MCRKYTAVFFGSLSAQGTWGRRCCTGHLRTKVLHMALEDGGLAQGTWGQCYSGHLGTEMVHKTLGDGVTAGI